MSNTVVFSKDIYASEAVKQAIEDYAELATFELTEGGADMVVTIDKLDPELQEVLVDEFCNHVLQETVTQRGGGQIT